MSFQVTREAGLQLSPQSLIFEIETRIEEFNIEISRLESLLESNQPVRTQIKIRSLIRQLQDKTTSLLREQNILQNEIQVRESLETPILPFTQIPQIQQIGDIPPQNNTLRNALIVGGVLLLII